MNIDMSIRKALGIALFGCIGLSFSVIAGVKGKPAPEANADEAKIQHWRYPDSDVKFMDIAELKEAYISAAPQDRGDGIPVGKLGKTGADKEKIMALANEIAQGMHGQYDSMLISHNGKLVFESYFRRGRVDLSHPQSSATKSYTGLALGRAIQLGYLSMEDLDKPVIHFLKDIDTSSIASGTDKVTLLEALTMTTGLRVSEQQWEKMSEDPDSLRGQGEIQKMFEQSEPITADKQVFRYGTGPILVMQVIEAVVPGTARDFIQRELFAKMGITNYDWRTALSGLPESGWKMSLTSRDMAKIGLLALNKGKWNAEQLVSEAYLKKATSRIILPGDEDVFGGGKDVLNQGYGFFWWSADLRSGDKSYFSASAQGGGGMYIILLEELNLSIVFTAHHRDNETLQMTAQRIIPAFI